MEAVLDLRGIEHRYGATIAVAGVDLQVAPGRCVALLGPNGAGKTTLVGLSIGLLTPQRGTATVAGGDPRRARVRRHLGVVQQSVGFPRTLTVAELVRGAAVRSGVPADAGWTALDEVGIGDLASRRAGKLSGGQQQRVQLAMALVGDPDLLVLDEPTVGLDVEARRAFWRTIAARRDRGTGVLLTTHIVEEAASVADLVTVLREGRVVATDTAAGLTERLPDKTVSVRTSLDDGALGAIIGPAGYERAGDRVVVGHARPEPLVRTLIEADPDLTDLRVEGASLEQALVYLTSGDRAAAESRSSGLTSDSAEEVVA